MTTSKPSPRDFGEVPVNATLGFELLERSPTAARVRAPAAQAFLQEMGVVHGGILSTLADTAAVHMVLPGLAPGTRLASIEFKVNFLAPARAGEGPIVASARMVKDGRRIILAEVDVEQAGKVVARGSFTYIKIGGSYEDPAQPLRES